MTKYLQNLTLSLFLFFSLAASQLQAGELLDRIIAVAGNDVVMISELRIKAREMITKLRSANVSPMPNRNQILTRALDSLILEKLQLAEAQRLGIDADAKTINSALARIAEANQLNPSQLRQALVKEGMDFVQFREGIKNQIILSRLINSEVTNRIQVSKSEINQQLARQKDTSKSRNAVHLLHIFVQTPDAASSQQIQAAKDKAIKARARIDAGESFRAVAQAVSDGSKAINGGDIGWLEADELPDNFVKPLLNMQAGGVKGPFRSSLGFHIIKAVAFRDGGDRSIVRQTHARHILIRTDEVTSDSDAKQRLEQLRERIIGGDDFDTLARSNSADKASAIKGGDLDWVSPGNMVPSFEEKMNSTAVGQTSEPFKTRFGWHIVQVMSRRNHDATEESQRNAARKIVRDRKAKEATEQYLRRLRDEAYIEMRLETIEQ